jgi:hypothetical protein
LVSFVARGDNGYNGYDADKSETPHSHIKFKKSAMAFEIMADSFEVRGAINNLSPSATFGE